MAEDNYIIHCVYCKEQKSSLQMVAHRSDGKMVGWFFVCADCEQKVHGKELEFKLKIPEEVF